MSHDMSGNENLLGGPVAHAVQWHRCDQPNRIFKNPNHLGEGVHLVFSPSFFLCFGTGTNKVIMTDEMPKVEVYGIFINGKAKGLVSTEMKDKVKHLRLEMTNQGCEFAGCLFKASDGQVIPENMEAYIPMKEVLHPYKSKLVLQMTKKDNVVLVEDPYHFPDGEDSITSDMEMSGEKKEESITSDMEMSGEKKEESITRDTTKKYSIFTSGAKWTSRHKYSPDQIARVPDGMKRYYEFWNKTAEERSMAGYAGWELKKRIDKKWKLHQKNTAAATATATKAATKATPLLDKLPALKAATKPGKEPYVELALAKYVGSDKCKQELDDAMNRIRRRHINYDAVPAGQSPAEFIKAQLANL
ncbi:uncharacterized protein LOC118431002 isoform X2 [Branchiostoma floridae]|uniref:Uncharacterized protein LOC118431002 isoform X2 n=1 Tax=Branchiostoma floridae TaxID=7739 RepID=A0A9J7MC71_BRAFL|nr:uncharacterized protein LOC118431002 isoform X2 [Branchiostoma floridae]